MSKFQTASAIICVVVDFMLECEWLEFDGKWVIKSECLLIDWKTRQTKCWLYRLCLWVYEWKVGWTKLCNWTRFSLGCLGCSGKVVACVIFWCTTLKQTCNNDPQPYHPHSKRAKLEHALIARVHFHTFQLITNHQHNTIQPPHKCRLDFKIIRLYSNTRQTYATAGGSIKLSW